MKYKPQDRDNDIIAKKLKIAYPIKRGDYGSNIKNHKC